VSAGVPNVTAGNWSPTLSRASILPRLSVMRPRHPDELRGARAVSRVPMGPTQAPAARVSVRLLRIAPQTPLEFKEGCGVRPWAKRDMRTDDDIGVLLPPAERLGCFHSVLASSGTARSGATSVQLDASLRRLCQAVLRRESVHGGVFNIHWGEEDRPWASCKN
jgi:hypothetical protein